MVRYNNQAVAACLLMTTYLSSSYFGGGMLVVQAHEEPEVHDEYDDHTHEPEESTTTLTTTRVGGGNNGNNNVKDSWSYLQATTLPSPMSDVSIAKMTTQEGQLVIVLTGGCTSPNGNELVMEEWGEVFSCKNITSQAFAFVPKRDDESSSTTTSSGLWSGTFESLPDMPRPRYRHGSATINNGSTLCVIGGRDVNDNMIAEIDCYNSQSQLWSTPSSLPNEHLVSDLAAFAYTPGSGNDDDEGVMVIVGGYTGPYMATENVTLIKYTLSDDNGDDTIGNVTYITGPHLLSKRGDVDVAIVADYVYVSGGFTHEDEFAMPKNTVERIALSDLLLFMDNLETVTTTTWSNVDSLNQERGDKQLVGLNGRVYAMGGETKIDGSGTMDAAPEVWERSEVLDTVEVYDPNADVHGGLAEWRVLSDMPAQIFRFAAIEWQPNEDETGVIFVFGGQVGYDADDCTCFRTTEKVMVLDVELAELEMMNGAASSSAMTSTALFISVVAFAFAGIVFCLAM